jgi:aldehyde dehydrogenase (NAD+)
VIHTGLFINNEFVDPIQPATIDVHNPATGKVVCQISAGDRADVEKATEIAKKAYHSSWGHKMPASQRGVLLNKLADLLERDADEFAALEALDVGKTFKDARAGDVAGAIGTLRYYAGWADKIHGKTIETNETKVAFTRHEPFGVVGQIIPWNFPLLMLSWKISPALATGNTIVLKPSEITPLTAMRFCSLIKEAGIPPGVLNIINGYGNTVGRAISESMTIQKVAFTGSTATGRTIMKAAADSNLKNVTLELGGKSPTIIFDDANLEQAVKWAAKGIYLNQGQVCCAGSRIFVQEGIHEQFLKAFAVETEKNVLGDPFDHGTTHGPQVSQTQFDKIMEYIDSGKKEGATLHTGGERHGDEGYFIKPTIFTDCKPEMKIMKEEIFGPVASIVKFKDEDDVVQQANDTEYGLAACVFTENLNRSMRITNALEAGTVWVNCANSLDYQVPFGGFKQSGIGRELGEYALEVYTQVKSVHLNIGINL